MTPLLEVDGLYVDLQYKPILKDISFSVQPGEICALVGHNGAGKTVTLRTLMGLQPKKSGTIRLGGCNLDDDREAYKRQYAYIPEEPLLFRELTVRQHVQLYGLSYGLPESLFEEKAAQYSELFELTDKLDEYPSELSKGMRQKVNLISCLLTEAPLLIVDEPFIGLDVQAAARLEQELRARADRGLSVLLTSHVLERVKAFGDSYILLKEGELQGRGALAELEVAEVART